jgi:hypothetical protein
MSYDCKTVKHSQRACPRHYVESIGGEHKVERMTRTLREGSPIATVGAGGGGGGGGGGGDKKEETSGENPSIRAIESTHGFETSSCTGAISLSARAASDEVYLHDLLITCGRGNKGVGRGGVGV